MQKDIDYVVKNGEVIIVDEFTGRLMIGRRYNEGLTTVPLEPVLDTEFGIAWRSGCTDRKVREFIKTACAAYDVKW